jgi:two-component system chemotaxis response regulator CheB
VIVIGASAGGVENLVRLVRDLPADLPAAVFVVLHIPAAGPSVLAAILGRAGSLPAAQAHDGDQIRRGHILVAPPDCHLLVQRGQVRVVKGPKENGHRPAVDALFRSAAEVYRERVIGVILSGMLDDGTAGLRDVKAAAGAAVVLDPSTTIYAGMPSSAIANVEVDDVAPIEQLAGRILKHVGAGGSHGGEELAGEPTRSGLVGLDDQRFAVDDDTYFGRASGFSCPGCGGGLWELDEGDSVRFRCHVGHSFSLESMLAAQDSELDKALFTAVRALREKAAMGRRLARRMRERNVGDVEERLHDDARQAEEAAEALRVLILERVPRAVDPDMLQTEPAT